MAKKDQKYAGFWIRVAASLVDAIITGTIYSLLRKIPFLPFPIDNFNFLIPALYDILLWVNWDGQTVGKSLFGLKIVREDKEKIDYKTAVIRYLGAVLASIPLCLGFLWVVWDKKKQGWHDKIAKTLVVKD